MCLYLCLYVCVCMWGHMCVREEGNIYHGTPVKVRGSLPGVGSLPLCLQESSSCWACIASVFTHWTSPSPDVFLLLSTILITINGLVLPKAWEAPWLYFTCILIETESLLPRDLRQLMDRRSLPTPVFSIYVTLQKSFLPPVIFCCLPISSLSLHCAPSTF